MNLKDIILIIIAVALFGLAGRFTLAANQYIEITAQSLVILTGVYMLTKWPAIVSIFIYLIAGLAGLPIFKDGASGIESLTGNTGGYLIGFLVATIFIKVFFDDRRYTFPWYKILATFCLATLVLLICGTIWLSTKIGFKDAMTYGFTPFIIPGLIKSILSMVLILIAGELYVRFFEKPKAQS